ncbi:hypothetical protein QM012_005445 [Aureobasidium pullulans]|uniref:Alpha/beta-hydrolase n=1 Tax=Aureobasidium pullulans TaxID=5580 RepID=A0ABR0T524_AURPU
MKLSLLLSSATLASAIVIQPPLGRYGVASTVMELVDNSRNDTYAPKPEPRRIMVSAFFPANSLKKCQPVMLPYMPPATAVVYDEFYAPLGVPNGTFGTLELSTCAFNRKDRSRGPNNFPIVLFSPGMGAKVGEFLGTMDGATAIENVNAFVGQFFKFVEHKSEDLLPKDMAKKFPEARVLDEHVCK